MNWDWQILYTIQKWHTPLLDNILPHITALGNAGFIWIVCVVLMLAHRRYRPYGIMLGLGLLSGLIVGNGLLKNLVARPRPCWLDPSVPLLIDNPKDYSFPSGHTLSSTIAAVLLCKTRPHFGLIAIPLALLIAFSRLYLFVHFPSDVLAAALLGIALAYITYCACEHWLFPRLQRHTS